jgi:hypothetical protein
MPLFLYAFAIGRRCCSCALAVSLGSSSTFFGIVPVLRCPVFFYGTNYFVWIPHICLHIRGLRLCDFLTGELPWLPHPSIPAELVITEKTITIENEKLIADYEDHLAFYELHFRTYKTWLDGDARAGPILTASMDDHFAADIVEFERTHQMWSFLHQKY